MSKVEQRKSARLDRSQPGGTSTQLGTKWQTGYLKMGNDEHSETRRDWPILLGIFPQEIWEMIFDHLDANSSLENASIASLFFRNIVLEKRVIFLFPKICGVLILQYESMSGRDRSYNPAGRRGTTTYSRTKACDNWLPAILKLGLVCKSWNASIEDFLHTIQLNENMKASSSIVNYFFDVTTFDKYSLGDISRRMAHFEQTYGVTGERNPFPGRSIRIKLGRSREEDGVLPFLLINSLKQMLSLYGHHIWYCEISGCKTRPYSYFYLKIRELLPFMQKLKILTLNYSPELEGNTAQDINQLEADIGRYPLMANFANLEVLRTTNLSTSIFNHVVRRTPNVTGFGEKIFGEYDIYSVPLPRLKNLSVVYSREADFEKLCRSYIKWPLEKLAVDFDNGLFIRWNKIFLILEEKCANTLVDLEITLPEPQREDERNRIARQSNLIGLNLNCVTTLKLQLQSYSSLDFILPMRETLQFLDVAAKFKNGEDCNEDFAFGVRNGQMLKFLGYFERPLESNIWRYFLRLKLMKLQASIGDSGEAKEIQWSLSRSEWKAHQQMYQRVVGVN